MMGGLPATVAALAINPPLGILIGVATVLAWKYGTSKQAEEDADALAASVSRDAGMRAAMLAEARAKWDEEFEHLTAKCECGDVSEEEGEALFEALIDRWPE